MIKSNPIFTNNQTGFTLIELLVVAAIIGILLAIAIPNLLKARISANEASAKKLLQTLRDAEGEFFEQDLNNTDSRNFTPWIGDTSVTTSGGSLRNPEGTGAEEDALIDDSFTKAVNTGSDGTGVAFGSTDAVCTPKAGYCVAWDDAMPTGITIQDYGWGASMTSFRKNGRKDFVVYGDGAIKCSVSTVSSSAPGKFGALRVSAACD